MAAFLEPPAGTATAPKYNEALRADIFTKVSAGGPKALVHRSEWAKVMAGDPVEINPSIGAGYKVMTVPEYTSKWKRNDDFPDCLGCGSLRTREHHFVQTWCRGKKQWESEALCLDCHAFSWRSYSDPDFLLPEEYEKRRWDALVADVQADVAAKSALLAHTVKAA